MSKALVANGTKLAKMVDCKELTKYKSHILFSSTQFLTLDELDDLHAKDGDEHWLRPYQSNGLDVLHTTLSILGW